jgi:hypothetical protein
VIVDSLPDACDPPGAEITIDSLPGRVLAGKVTPLATCAVDVEDRVNGQAHIGLTIPAARFRSRNQAFDILPFSVGQVIRVELVAHPAMLPKPTEDF